MVRSKIGQRILEGVLVLILLFVLAMAFLPFCIFSGGNSREAKVGEAKAAIGTIKDRMRVYYVQSENTLGGTGITTYMPEAATELTGEYYAASDYSIRSIKGTRITLAAEGSAKDSRPTVEYTFNCATGQSEGGFVVTPQ